jgi:hypothetical protein
MKTPREVLLERHRSATTRLDAIRREVVAELTSRNEPEAKPTMAARFLQEFLLPLRWHLAGMSALWVLAALLNMESAPTASLTAQNNAPPPQVFAALVENRRQLADMINSPAVDVAAPPAVPQPFVPRRRSARQPTSVVV